MAGSQKKTLVISSLLSGSTIGQAAVESGVSERSIYRWLGESGFQGELEQARERFLGAVTGKLLALSEQAVMALENVLAHPEQRAGNVKRLAAVSVLELALNYRELYLFEKRLSTLEREVLGNGKR